MLTITNILHLIGFALVIAAGVVWGKYYFGSPRVRGLVWIIEVWVLFVAGFYICVACHLIPNQWLNVWSTSIRLYTTTAVLFIGIWYLRTDR